MGRYHSNFRRKLKGLMMGVIKDGGLVHRGTIVHTSKLVQEASLVELVFSCHVAEQVHRWSHVRDQVVFRSL